VHCSFCARCGSVWGSTFDRNCPGGAHRHFLRLNEPRITKVAATMIGKRKRSRIVCGTPCLEVLLAAGDADAIYGKYTQEKDGEVRSFSDASTGIHISVRG